MPRRTSRTASASAPIPVVSPSWPMPPQETVEHLEVGLHYSCGVMLLFSVSWCMWDFVCALQEWCVSFPYLSGSPMIKSHCPSRSDDQGIPSPLSEPQAGFLDVRCRTFTIMGELLWYFCSPVTYSGVWDLNSLWLYPSYYLVATSTFSLNVGYHFWCVPVSSCW